MYSETPRTIHLKDYRPPPFLIDSVRLRLELDAGTTRVESRLALRRNPAAEPVVELELDGEGLELVSVTLDGRPLAPDAFRLEPTRLVVAAVPDCFELVTVARIHPDVNTALEGLYASGEMLCTQCEAEGFRKITWFLDRPDVMSRYTTTLVADPARYPVLLSNGNPVADDTLIDGRRAVTWEDPFPKPCYLFAVVAGDLGCVEERYTTGSGREIALRCYVDRGNEEQCGHALASLRRAMAWDEREYGREYDLDLYMIVAVDAFNMGAMENKGLNIFNAKYVLARHDTATDADFQAIEGVIAHEYFHNWTGNRITCRDWFQLSLKEGLTVFRDQEFSADMNARGVKRIDDARLLRAHQFAEDAGPMAHPVRPESYIEINNFYTVTVYEKGAEVVRMQRTLLGRDGFRRGIDLYFTRHDGQAVTCDDFVRCMEDANGVDLGQFRRWYSQAGTPEVEAECRHDRATGRVELTLRQSCPPTPGQPRKEPFHIPVAVGLVGVGGDLPLRLDGEPPEAAATTRVLELKAPEQRFSFVGVAEPVVPSLLRGLSAPVKLRYTYDDAELIFLLGRDGDDFARWDAAQELWQRLILAAVASGRAGRLSLSDELVAALRRLLTDPMADPALVAELLRLPGEGYLGDQMEVVDVDGIHHARSALRRAIGAALIDEFRERYAGLAEPGRYRPEATAIGRRALRNLALGYLMAADEATGRLLATAQFDAGHNMTDVLAALALLADSDSPERSTCLAAFEARWRDQPLVLDKWFTIQAGADRPDVLTEVVALMGHPGFSIRNPNRVRALVGAFASGNPFAFHAADGSGYRFLADRVLELDALNPQVAARMARLMARWRRYDPARQHRMRAELERVLAAGPSNDLYEIVHRALD